MIIWNEFDKKKIEKKRINKVSNAIGGAFLIGYVILNVMPFLMGNTINTLYSLNENIAGWIIQIVFSAFFFTVPFILMSGLMNTRISVCVNLGRPEKGTLAPLILVGCTVCMLSNILGAQTSSIFEMLGIEDAGDSLMLSPEYGIVFPVLGLLAGSLLPALVEEFALRGVCMGALRRFGDGFAIIASAALFGIMHGSISQMPFAFMLGLYLGFMVIKTGTLWASIILHAVNNVFSMALGSLEPMVSQQTYNLVNIFYFIIMLALGFIGLMLAKNKSVFSLKPQKQTELSLGEKLGALFSSATIIIFLIYTAVTILISQLELLI